MNKETALAVDKAKLKLVGKMLGEGRWRGRHHGSAAGDRCAETLLRKRPCGVALRDYHSSLRLECMASGDLCAFQFLRNRGTSSGRKFVLCFSVCIRSHRNY